MRIELKVNDVIEMTEEKRHVFLVDNKELKRCIMQHQEFVKQEIIREILAHDAKLMSEILDDKDLRNTIYMQENAKREAKSEQRKRHRLFEIEKRRIQEQHQASINYRKHVDFIHEILGWKKDGEL